MDIFFCLLLQTDYVFGVNCIYFFNSFFFLILTFFFVYFQIVETALSENENKK